MKTKKTKQSLVSALRFPEFEEDGEWEEEIFSDVYRFITTNSFSRAKLNYENGKVKNIHYGDIHTKFQPLFDITKEDVPFVNLDVSIEKIKPENYCIESDIVFADASEDLEDIGKSIEIVNLNNEKLLAGLHTLLARQKKKNKVVTGFGAYLFKSPSVRKQIQKEAQGTKVLGISTGRLSSIGICLPRSPKEQQKIADCLRSLDQLMGAHETRLERLKNHKKGLMQQLFPQEGEKVPRLRFPEFKSDGEWEEKRLGKLAKVITGNKDTKDKVDSGLYPFFVRSQNVERINSYSFDGEAILTSGDGVGVGKNFHYIIGKFDFHQRVYAIYDFTKGVLGKYLFMYFSQYFYDRVMKMSAKNSVDSVRKAMITDMPIKLPSPKEQQKIADCLSSLDTLIAAEAQKIEALGKHKKGLMQQLFPEINR